MVALTRESNETAVRRYDDAWKAGDLPAIYDDDRRAVDELWS